MATVQILNEWPPFQAVYWLFIMLQFTQSAGFLVIGIQIQRTWEWNRNVPTHYILGECELFVVLNKYYLNTNDLWHQLKV